MPIALVHLIPYWLFWAEVKCMLHVVLPKRPINEFKLDQQSRQQALKAYCPNIYTVVGGSAHHNCLTYFVNEHFLLS